MNPIEIKPDDPGLAGIKDPEGKRSAAVIASLGANAAIASFKPEPGMTDEQRNAEIVSVVDAQMKAAPKREWTKEDIEGLRAASLAAGLAFGADTKGKQEFSRYMAARLLTALTAGMERSDAGVQVNSRSLESMKRRAEKAKAYLSGITRAATDYWDENVTLQGADVVPIQYHPEIIGLLMNETPFLKEMFRVPLTNNAYNIGMLTNSVTVTRRMHEGSNYTATVPTTIMPTKPVTMQPWIWAAALDIPNDLAADALPGLMALLQYYTMYSLGIDLEGQVFSGNGSTGPYGLLTLLDTAARQVTQPQGNWYQQYMAAKFGVNIKYRTAGGGLFYNDTMAYNFESAVDTFGRPLFRERAWGTEQTGAAISATGSTKTVIDENIPQVSGKDIIIIGNPGHPRAGAFLGVHDEFTMFTDPYTQALKGMTRVIFSGRFGCAFPNLLGFNYMKVDPASVSSGSAPATA